jgi:chorismate mutase
MAADISALRQELQVLDRDLVKLLAAREAVVAKIAALKAAQGIPMHDEQQEQRFLSRAHAVLDSRPQAPSAAPAGAGAPALVDAVFEAIFKHARGGR